MLSIHKDSHLDHGLSNEAIAFILDKFQDRDGFFIESFELPEKFGKVQCALYGPTTGDGAVTEDEVEYLPRNGRAYPSRMVRRPMRPTSTVTVIAGPHDGESCVLHTAFGGPLAEKEPGDPTSADAEKAEAFWSTHALALEG